MGSPRASQQQAKFNHARHDNEEEQDEYGQREHSDISVGIAEPNRGSEYDERIRLHGAAALLSDDVPAGVADGEDPPSRNVSRSMNGSPSSHYGGSIGASSPPPLAASPPPAALERSQSHAGGPFTDEEDQHHEEFLKVTKMHGYQFSWFLEIRWWIMCMCSGFSLWLAGLWFPAFVVPWRYRRVPLKEATFVHVFGRVHGADLVPVQELGQDVVDAEEEVMHRPSSSPRARAAARRNSMDLLSAGQGGRMIVFRHMRYIYSPATQQFVIQQSDVASRRAEALGEGQRHTSVAALKAKELTERLRVGLTRDQLLDNRVLYGENALILKVPTIPELLFGEIFHPFYVFQMYSVVLWGFEAYWYYAGAIILIATVSIVQTLVETRRRMREMAELARFDCPVQVWRDGALRTISSTHLVPGDIVHVGTGLLPCDLSLLEGGCVVNESMLTGESVPVIKANVQWPVQRMGDTVVPLTSDSRHTLFAATKVMQLKPLTPGAPVTAIVVRTGFATTKGALLLSILYPAPSTFQFVTQSYKFICALFCLAMVGFAVSVWQLKWVQGAEDGIIVIRALDLITIVVPPSLPLALSVGTNFALLWLRRDKIFCIAPARITMAGKVKLCCFDKTGTLTEESLEFSGVYAADGVPDEDSHAQAVGERKEDPEEQGKLQPYWGKFQSPQAPLMEQLAIAEAPHRANGLGHDSEYAPHSNSFTSSYGTSLGRGGGLGSMMGNGYVEAESFPEDSFPVEPAVPLAPGEPDTFHKQPLSAALKVSLACCQSLAVMDGTLIGDPLEQQTFDAAGATLQDTGDLQGYQQIIRVQLTPSRTVSMGVAHQFEFSSALQRMAVVCTDLNSGHHYAFVKGSPEMMQTLCRPSTLPADFKNVLGQFARKGYRVIAIARKRMAEIPVMEKPELRLQVESDLTFLGLVLLVNKIKPESEPTLMELKKAMIRCCMITGDHSLTAVTVAKECQLVDPGTRIFQSALVPDASVEGGFRLEWQDTDDEHLKLDPLSLRLPPHVLQDWKGPTPLHYELALTGPAFKLLQEMEGSEEPASLFHRVLLNTQIAARFSPDQKAAFISELQSLGIYCSMTGDGANDCGALKTAHVGISLSESEASIAAPFTYARPNISCLPLLLAEGRASLITSFQLFRFMAMYSMIQFGAVILTYFQGSVLGNWQYLYADLFIVFPLTIFMGATRARRVLSAKRPSGNLLSWRNCSNLIVHMALCMGFQIGVYSMISSQPDYVKLDNPENGPRSYNTTALYYFSNFAYIVVAVLFAQGGPWKARISSNWQFSAWVLVGLATSLAMLLSPYLQPKFFRSDDQPLPWSWRRSIGVYALCYAGCAALWDLLLSPLLCRIARKVSRKGLLTGTVFGRVKPMQGKASKLYHRMRGEFEANWVKPNYY